MTDAILPGQTFPGSIKGSADHARSLSLFSFPLGWQQDKTNQYER